MKAAGTLLGEYRVISVSELGIAEIIEDDKDQAPVLTVPVSDLALVRKGKVQ